MTNDGRHRATRSAENTLELRDDILEISKSTNTRIAVSSAIIFLILIVIAFSLTDYLGFSRGWTFFVKLVTGQSVTETTVSTDDVYNNLLPLFRDYDNQEKILLSYETRIGRAQSYLVLIDDFVAKSSIAVPDGKDLYPAFIGSISSLRSDSANYTDCSRVSGQFFIDDSYSYTSREGVVPVTPSFRFCQIGEDGGDDARVEFPTVNINLTSTTDIRNALLAGVSNKDFEVGIGRLRSALAGELDNLRLLRDTGGNESVEAKNRINKAIEQSVALNKVDVGQDVSFIVSRAFLLVTLISLAATSLRVILNEIRFSNRLNEVRVASGYSLLHSDPSILANIYKTQTRDGELGKADADAGLSSRDVKELFVAAMQSLTKDEKNEQKKA